MITITATPAPDRHAIDLVILAAAPATLVSLRRTDANGADDVRLPELPTTFEAITLADYEAALTGIIQYEAAVTTGVDEIHRRNLYNPDTLIPFGLNTGTSKFARSEQLYRGYALPVTPGEVYSFRRMVPLSNRFRVVFSATPPAQDVPFFGGSVSARFDVEEVMEGVTVPAGAEYMFVYLTNQAESISGLLIEKAETAGPYFDGDTIPTSPTQRARWTGAAGASTSELYTPAGTTLLADAVTEFSGLEPFTWLMHPAVMPEDSTQVTFVNWNMTRATRSARHVVIGRPDPIVNRDVLGLRTGTLDVFATSYDDVQRIIAVCERQETVMIRQNDFPGLDGYFEVDEVTPTIKLDTARPGAVRWLVRLTLTEVTIPTGPLLAPTGWTYGTVAAEFGSYRAVRNTYRTYRDLLLDERVA